MNNIKKILLLFLVLLMFGAIWFYYNWSKDEFIPAKEKIVSINLSSKERPLFLKAKTWGIAGNHEEIILSKSNDKLSNKTEDYIFFTSEVFYKVERDTVILYAPESSISEPKVKIQHVIVNSLKTADEIKDYRINYKKYGLKSISVYK